MNNNEFDNFEIPKEIDLFIKNSLNKAIIDKKRRKNKIAKMAISASIMGAIFTGFSLNVIAQRMPFLNNVFEELKNNKSENEREVEIAEKLKVTNYENVNVIFVDQDRLVQQNKSWIDMILSRNEK